MELLIISILMFGGGYGLSEYMDEEVICKEVVLTTPTEALEPVLVKDCLEHDKSEQCDVGYPRVVLHTDEYKKDIGHGIITRESLKQCVNAVDTYNKNKSIKR